MSTFNKGDRVKFAAFEGVVSHAGPSNNFVELRNNDGIYVGYISLDHAPAKLVPPPLPPFSEGDVLVYQGHKTRIRRSDGNWYNAAGVRQGADRFYREDAVTDTTYVIRNGKRVSA